MRRFAKLRVQRSFVGSPRLCPGLRCLRMTTGGGFVSVGRLPALKGEHSYVANRRKTTGYPARDHESWGIYSERTSFLTLASPVSNMPFRLL